MGNDVADGREIAVMQQILLPESHRIHAEPFGDQIHLRLVGEETLGVSRRAHVPARNFVGVNDLFLDEHVRDSIRSSGFLGPDQIALGLKRSVGAAVEDIFHLMRNQPAGLVDPGLYPDASVPPGERWVGAQGDDHVRVTAVTQL